MNNDTTKLCPQCSIEKPISEFPLTHRKKPARICKACGYERQKGYTVKKKHQASRPSEDSTIAEMKRHGIFATSGKASDYHYVDVVAWGCVRVEVKLATKDGNGYTVSFSDDQVKDGIRGDVVVMIIPSEFGDAYYVLPVDFPLFYREGKLQYRMSVTMNAQREAWRWQMVSRYRAAWHLIEEARWRVIQGLGQIDPAPAVPTARCDTVSKPDTQQLILL